MKVAVAVHQLSTSYLQAMIGPSDEDPRPDRLDPQDAIGAIYGKVLDGLSWMSEFDQHPNAISGFESVATRAMDHTDRGRDWLPWANVTGVDPVREGQLAGQIAGVVGTAKPRSYGDVATFIANVEPYPQFWPWREATAAKAREYVAAFRHAGGTDLRLWVDARSWQLSDDRGIGLRYWLNAIWEYDLDYRVLPEVYWTDFGRGPRASLQQAVDLLHTNYGVPFELIEPTFPGDADPADMVAAIQAAHTLGLGRPNIWQRMSLRTETAVAIAKMDDPWSPGSTYPVPIQTAEAMLARAVGASAELASIREDREAISQRLDTVRDRVEAVIAVLERLGEVDLTPPDDPS